MARWWYCKTSSYLLLTQVQWQITLGVGMNVSKKRKVYLLSPDTRILCHVSIYSVHVCYAKRITWCLWIKPALISFHWNEIHISLTQIIPNQTNRSERKQDNMLLSTTRYILPCEVSRAAASVSDDLITVGSAVETFLLECVPANVLLSNTDDFRFTWLTPCIPEVLAVSYPDPKNTLTKCPGRGRTSYSDAQSLIKTVTSAKLQYFLTLTCLMSICSWITSCFLFLCTFLLRATGSISTSQMSLFYCSAVCIRLWIQ